MNTTTVNAWCRCCDRSTFVRIEDCPLMQLATPGKPVVELVVGYALADIEKYVMSVHRVQGRDDDENCGRAHRLVRG